MVVGEDEALLGDRLVARDVNWLSVPAPDTSRDGSTCGSDTGTPRPRPRCVPSGADEWRSSSTSPSGRSPRGRPRSSTTARSASVAAGSSADAREAGQE